MMITAKRLALSGELGEAVRLIDQSLMSIKGVEEEYIETLRALMDAQFSIHLARSLDIEVSEAERGLKEAFQELNRKHFDTAMEAAGSIDTDIRRRIDDFKTSPEDRVVGGD
jgi:predicted MarR family transcription regulator